MYKYKMQICDRELRVHMGLINKDIQNWEQLDMIYLRQDHCNEIPYILYR